MFLSFAEQVRTILHRQNKSIEDLAMIMNTTRQNLWNQLKRDNFKYNDMFKIAAALDCELIIELKEREPDGSRSA